MIWKYEGYFLAKSTIVHHGNEKTGSTPVLRTIYLYHDEFGEVLMPYINGNAIRGKLRRLLMKDFFDLLNIDIKEINAKLYHIFFSGGILESTDENTGIIDLSFKNEIYNYIPVLGLMGSAIGNQMIQGCLKVGHAFPVCKEFASFLPEFLKNNERTKLRVRTFTDESFRTRRDELKANREEDENPIQMKVDYECFIPGTLFYHWFALEYPSDVIASTLGRAMNLFQKSPFIGGMSGIGNGEIEFSYQNQLPDENLYLDFIEKNKDDIKKVINDINKKL